MKESGQAPAYCCYSCRKQASAECPEGANNLAICANKMTPKPGCNWNQYLPDSVVGCLDGAPGGTRYCWEERKAKIEFGVYQRFLEVRENQMYAPDVIRGIGNFDSREEAEKFIEDAEAGRYLILEEHIIIK